MPTLADVGTAELDALISILDAVNSTRLVLLVEPTLVPLLSALAPYSALTDHGVVAIVPLTSAAADGPPMRDADADDTAIVYISRATPASVTLVAQNAAQARPGAPKTLVVVPEIAPSVRVLLERQGVLGDVDLVAWGVGFVPDAAQPDILSLFDDSAAFDPRAGMWLTAWALDALQQHVGAFGRITSVGGAARRVAQLVSSLQAERAVQLQQQPVPERAGYRGNRQWQPQARHQRHDEDESSASTAGSPRLNFDYEFGYTSHTFQGTEIDQVIIIDRSLDLVTPLLSQTTYEGVLAETLGISASGTINSSATPDSAALKASLRSDPLFASIGERGFADACSFMHDSAKQLQTNYRDESVDQSASLADIRATVTKLGSLQASQRLVDTHTQLASAAMAELERGVRREGFELQTAILENRITNTQAVARIQDLVFRGAEIGQVLRLLSLLCLVRGGLKESVLNALTYGDILKTYGYEHLSTIRHLHERGLIFPPKATSFLSSAPFSLGIGFGSSSSPSTPAAASSPAPSGAHGGMTSSSSAAGPLGVANGGPATGSSAAGVSAGHGALGASGSDQAGTPASAGRLLSSLSLAGSGTSAGAIGGSANGLIDGPGLDEPLAHTHSWYALNKAYHLYPNDVDAVPVAKTYAGYVPLTARVAQLALGIEPVSKTPLEAEFSDELFLSKDAKSAREAKVRRTLLRNTDGHSRRAVLVVVLGGVTYAEATAIRLAAQGPQLAWDVVVASTSVLTGNAIAAA